jgi:polysaccharide export outer membrane protein
MKKSPGLWQLPTLGLLLACVLVLNSSCGNVRDIQYLQGQFDTAKLSQVNYPAPLIQKNDLLNITVYSDDPKASSYFNLPPITTIQSSMAAQAATGTTSAPEEPTYLVDLNGEIQMPGPGLGKIHVAGLTKQQLDSLLVSRLKDQLNHPYVVIRLASYKVTLIGEVAKPGQFTIPNERISLLEAIALAGDLTPFARRDNVLVIREINGERSYQRLNLKDPYVLNSPYYFLQPNDMVIVEPNKSKASASDQVVVRNISLAVSLISVIAVLITLSRTK